MIGALWNTLFYEPILNILFLLYATFGNSLGLAIIVLTLLLRIVLFPFMRSQMESSAKLRKLQPMLETIKKKYDRNPKKAQEEQMKLYRKVGYNPLGCALSMLLPFPFLIAIYQAISLFSKGKEITQIYAWVSNLLGLKDSITVSTMFLGLDLSKSYLPIAKDVGYLALAALPYLGLCLLTGLSQYSSMKMNQKLMGTPDESEQKKIDEKKKKKGATEPNMTEMMSQMGKSMSFTFPLMSVFIAVGLPAAVSLYWILQSWIPVVMYGAYLKFKKQSS